MKFTVGKYGKHEILDITKQKIKGRTISYADFVCDKCNQRSRTALARIGYLENHNLDWHCAACASKVCVKDLLVDLRTQTPIKTRLGTYAGGKRTTYATVVCAVCKKQFEGSIPSLRQMEAGAAKELRCTDCRTNLDRKYKLARHHATKPQTKPRCSVSDKTVAKNGGKLPEATIKALGRLEPEARRIADKLIFDHVAACRKQNVTIENLDRVVLEAIEEAQRETRHGAPTVTASTPNREPRWQYDQYVSPRV